MASPLFCATAGTVQTLVAVPADGLPNGDWTGSITIQRAKYRSDNTTVATGDIYISFPGVHNNNAGGTGTVSVSNYNCYLDANVNSVTLDLGTDSLSNSFARISQVLWTSSVNGEGIAWFTTED
jgi:hypothetical protein